MPANPQFLPALLIPITVRRLHYVGLPGYLSIITLGSYLAIISALIASTLNLFLYFKKGQENKNKYGEKPAHQTFWQAVLNEKTKHTELKNKKEHPQNMNWIILLSWASFIMIMYYAYDSYLSLRKCSLSDPECIATLFAFVLPVILFPTAVALPIAGIAQFLSKKKSTSFFLLIFLIICAIILFIMSLGIYSNNSL